MGERYINRRYKTGFTLIELLVVIAVIGILSAMGLVSLNGAREKARDAQRKSDLGQIRTGLLVYYDDHNNKFPSIFQVGTPDSVAVALTAPLKTTYLSRMPQDPIDDGEYSYWYLADAEGDHEAVADRFGLYANLEANGGANVYWISYSGAASNIAGVARLSGESCGPWPDEIDVCQ